MKISLFALGVATFLAGCYTQKEMVYEEPPSTTIVREPAGTALPIYEPGIGIYKARPIHPPKTGEYLQR